MPTASTAQILGTTKVPSLSHRIPTTDVYWQDNLLLSTSMNLLRDLTSLSIWNESLRNRLIADRGSVQNFEEIPQKLRDVYKTVWEVPQRVILDLAADHSPYICQSQSLNVHIADPASKMLTSMHFYAWKKGLKTEMY